MGFGALLEAADQQTVGRLGEPISYTPLGGSTTTPSGIFDASYAPIDSDHHGVVGAHPAVFFRLTDLPSDPDVVAPTIVIAAPFEQSVRGTYSVAEVHKDGYGGVVLILQKTS
jgi:hypothetical protein